MATQGETSDTFLHSTEGAEAIIFVVSASGTVGERFGSGVTQRVKGGVPVFLVSTNIANAHGILKANTYDASTSVLEGGAIPIEKYNAKDVRLLFEIISKYLDQGLKGRELGEAVRNETSYKEGDMKPEPVWETPEGAVELAKSTEQTLRRQGMSEEEIARFMSNWRRTDIEWLPGKLK